MAYLIHKQNFYYSGTLGVPSDGFLTDDHAHLLEFETEAEAQAHIDTLEDGVYVLSHGEYSRPEYTIRPDDSPLETADCPETAFVPGDEAEGGQVVAPDDIPAEIKEALDAASVEFYSSDGSIETWRTEVETTELIYGINYYPRSAAVQMAALTGDLSNVDWANAIYTRREA